VTHGDVWLPFLLTLRVSYLPIQRVLRAALSAYLGRYRGETRVHTDSDLRVFLRWCTDQDLEPLAAARADIERYVRWLQDVRRHQPSTVSRRLSVVVGFYRVCVIEAILDHSPADYVRRPTVPAESPTQAGRRPAPPLT
jgi:site-specific recombinase XerD